MKKSIIVGLVCLLTTIASTALAVPINFTQIGRGSGTIGNMSFFDKTFTISAVSDTADRLAFGSGYSIDNFSASIDIVGVGAFTFLTPTRFFVNNVNDTVGFSRAGISGLDLFNGPTDPQFGSWDMLSGIGPVIGQGVLLQWSNTPMFTNQGILVFNTAPTAALFEADAGSAPIPEPATMTMIGISLAGLGMLRRRIRG